jgi:RNA polymerase sigma-70 factor (ECF subfamily)
MIMSTIDIWKNYRLQLFNFIKRQVQDPHIAKDILQDVFIKAETRKNEVRDVNRMGGWMFSITRNAIADHFRKNNKEKRLIEQLDTGEIIPEPFYNGCVAQCLHQLIFTLPQPYQDALIKTEIEGIPQTALAEVLGLSHSGAKSRVQRARRMLKEKLMELYTIQTDAYGNILVCEDKVPCKCAPDINCS